MRTQHPKLKIRREPYSTKVLVAAFEGTTIIKLIVQDHLVQFYREFHSRLSGRFMAFQGEPLYFDLTDPQSLTNLSKVVEALCEDYLDELRRKHDCYGEIIAIPAS